jgi:hypothetical protein
VWALSACLPPSLPPSLAPPSMYASHLPALPNGAALQTSTLPQTLPKLNDYRTPEQRARDAAERIKESQKINTSLLCLGNVIEKLTARVGPGRGKLHVPFRASKLTMLLRNAFGGNSLTSVVVTATPAADRARDTLASLRFGDRASALRNAPRANRVLSVEELQRQVRESRALLDSRAASLQLLQTSLSRLRNAASALLVSAPSAHQAALLRLFPALRGCVGRGAATFRTLPAYVQAHVVTFCGEWSSWVLWDVLATTRQHTTTHDTTTHGTTTHDTTTHNNTRHDAARHSHLHAHTCHELAI